MSQNVEFSSDEEDDDYDPTRETGGEGEEGQGTKKSKQKRGKKGHDLAGGSGRRGAELAKADSALPAGGLGRGRVTSAPVDPLAELKAEGRKSKINDIWEQLKAKEAEKKRPQTTCTPLFQSAVAEPKKTVGLGRGSKQPQPSWMAGLGTSGSSGIGGARSAGPTSASSAAAPGGSSALSLAAAALAAAKATADAPVIDKDGKIEVKETVSFAGDQVVVTKLVDAESKAAAAAKRKAEAQGASKGIDALLAQIEKKKKLNILDKSRMDWGEFKEETGIVTELEDHKKSGDKYTEKVAFLQRAELREYEVERDQRLATQSRKPNLTSD